MSFRTNPDRILENIDRQRSRDEENAGRQPDDRQAVGRELDTTPPPPDATNPERMKRVFRLVEESYRQAAQGTELGKLACSLPGNRRPSPPSCPRRRQRGHPVPRLGPPR